MSDSNPLLAQLARARAANAARLAGTAPPAAPAPAPAPAFVFPVPDVGPAAPVVYGTDSGVPITAAVLAAGRDARRAAAAAAPAPAPSPTAAAEGVVLGGAPLPVVPQPVLAPPPPAAAPVFSAGSGVLGGSLLIPAPAPAAAPVAGAGAPALDPGSGAGMLAAARAKEAIEKRAAELARAELLRARTGAQSRPASRGFASGGGPLS
jgi:hypothetical protein